MGVQHKISVVMCCYNAEKYIEQTIDSVLSQSFCDFEFIIWDDGSTDSTRKIIGKFKDKRIRLFCDINRGEGQAARLACEQVSSKYIARIDSDDIWLPKKLAMEYDYLEAHPEVVLVSCPLIKIDENNNELGRSFPLKDIDYLTKSIQWENRFIHSGAMFRTDDYVKSGGYCDVRLFQDTLLFRRLSDYGKLALMPVPLIRYRILPNSVSHKVRTSAYAPIINELKKKIIKDKGYVAEDIKIFNQIYQNIGKENNDIYVYKKNIGDKLFLCLRKIMNESKSYKIISFLYNSFAITKNESIRGWFFRC